MNCDYIVVHCSDSPHGRGDTAGTIHGWHLARGWSGIGYHYVIEEDGRIIPGRPVFRDSKKFWPGAHVRRYNNRSIGICLIGRDTFTDPQMESLRFQLDGLKEIWPEAKIVGHCELDNSKTCPNFDVQAFLARQI